MTALEHGQSLEAHGRYAEALSAYDQAIVASRGDARAHGIAWMNRGNALQKIGAGSLPAAIDAYDRAIALFRTLALESDPAFRNHLGAAWLNRGHTFLVAGQSASAAESFAYAVAELEQLPLERDPHFRLNLAGARTNLAHVLLATETVRARAFAHAALAVLAEVERAHPAFAEMSLRARRAFGMALGPQTDRALVAEATDAIDEGLALARHWETQGVDELRPLAERLFRLGAQLYRVHQPQFLAEFVLESLAPGAFAADAGFRAAADEALALALAELPTPQVLTIDDATTARFVETARSLRAAQRQLSAFDVPLPTRSA